MLRSATWLIDFFGMALALWLAAYLISRGFRSAVTRWAGLILLLEAVAFLIILRELETPQGSHLIWWALVQTLALLAWYSLTYQLLSGAARRRVRWMAAIVYVLGAVKVIAISMGLVRSPLASATDFNLWVLNQGLVDLADVIFLLTAGAGTLVNFKLGSRTGYGPHFHALWVASVLGALAIAYGTVQVVMNLDLPRWVQDALLVGAIGLCGYSIARYQAFVERRTTLRDMPVSGMTVFGLAALYGWLGSREGLSAFQVALVIALAIVSHAAYDLVRDFLERVLHRHESTFRRQLRALARDSGGDTELSAHLAAGQETLVRLLGATGGFVAVRRAAGFEVMASLASVPVGTLIDASEAPAKDVSVPGPALAERVAWVAPAFAGEERVAIIALARRFNGGPYSEADLDLLVDMADWVGRLVEGEGRQRARRAELVTLASAVESGEAELQAQTQNLLTTLEAQPDRQFARQVEYALQHLSDFTVLGQSGLVDELRLPGATHIERGKAVRQQLLTAIDSLRPSETRPKGVLPREWQAYAILYDAYVDDVPNREIMARLYIGEGNFNRKRRSALQAVARALYETRHTTPPVALPEG